MAKLPIFTVDLEFWFQAVCPYEEWDGFKRTINGLYDYLLVGQISNSETNTICWLFSELNRRGISALVYVNGWMLEMNKKSIPQILKSLSVVGEKGSSHVFGSHGYSHRHNEKAGNESDIKTRKLMKDCELEPSASYRSPYWDTTPMPWPPSGGFFFRSMPYTYVKWAVETSGVFWIHPHDVMENHPRLKNPLLNWKRRIGQKTARAKLERLLSEIEWGKP